MNEISLVEWLGYGASALVLVSLSMSSIAKLRWFNLAGSACFAIYGYLIGAWPVAVVNFAIALVNIYFLFQLYIRKDYFKILEIAPNDAYLQEFLGFYESEIQQWYPKFHADLAPEATVLLVLRNLAVAGVFIGTPRDQAALTVVLDYVIPQFADRKVGRYLFHDNRAFLIQRGIRELVVDTESIRNHGYFRSMGFTASQPPTDGCLSLRLQADSA